MKFWILNYVVYTFPLEAYSKNSVDYLDIKDGL